MDGESGLPPVWRRGVEFERMGGSGYAENRTKSLPFRICRRHFRCPELAGGMIHQLKTWPEQFEALFKGLKTFEIRKNDRDFQVGDVLMLKEYDPEKSKYTERWVVGQVTCLLKDFEGIEPGYVVMSFNSVIRNGKK